MSGASRSLADLNALARLAQSGGPGLGSAALRAEARLLAERPAQLGVPEESAALIIAGLAQADRGEVDRIAAVLAPLPHTPPAVLRTLFERGAAREVLRLAPALPAELRRAAADSADGELTALLAARNDLDEADVDAMVAQADPAALTVLVENRAIDLGPAALGVILRLARSDQGLARALIEHRDVDCALLLPLYVHADIIQRHALRDRLALRMAERGVILRERAATEEERSVLLERALEGLKPLIEAVAEVSERGDAFIAATLADPTRDPLALALVALDVPPPEAIRMLLRTGDDIARDSRRLGVAVETLRFTPRPVASALLASCWPPAARLSRGAGQHVPVMAPGGTPSRPSGIGTQQRRPGLGEAIEIARGRR